jgi:hypothetical protein
MRRRRVIAGLAVLAVAVALIALWPRSPRKSLTTFQQVKPGMTREEVYTTVGGPPDRVELPPSERPWWAQGPEGLSLESGHWDAEDGSSLMVMWANDGRVKFAHVFPDPRPPFLQRFRARLGL